jgi:hypothetical protein
MDTYKLNNCNSIFATNKIDELKTSSHYTNGTWMVPIKEILLSIK